MASTTDTGNLDMDFVDECEQFLEQYYRDDLLELNEKYPKELESLYIDVGGDVYRGVGHEMVFDIVEHPKDVRHHIREAIARFEITQDISGVNIRFENLPDSREFYPGNFPSKLIGESISVRGQVSQLSPPKPKIDEAAFRCQRCGTMTRIPQGSTGFQEPHECGGCERQGPFQIDKEESEFVDYQLVRVTLPPEMADESQPHVDVVLTDDLAGEALNGSERVVIDGFLTTKSNNGSDNGVHDYLLEGEAVTVLEGGYDDVEIEEYKDEILELADNNPIDTLRNSLETKLSTDENLDRILTAATLQMFGSYSKRPDEGASFRGNWHMLLLGDPGTGKSEVLSAVEEVAPRCKMGSGGTGTKAGLTASAVKDDFGPKQWSLRPGLLVLANNGIAAVDEIDKFDNSELEATHRALSRERIDIDKAGINAKLPTRTSLLAAGNPEQNRFDVHQPIGSQIDLPPALMSRFDLMFMLRDQPDTERDPEIAEHIFDTYADSASRVVDDEGRNDDVIREVRPELFKAYIAYARENIYPQPPDDASELKQRVVDHYSDLREKGLDPGSPVPVTARKVEGILRLAESSARARLSETIEKEDIDRAIMLVMTSMSQVEIDPETGDFDANIVESGTSKTQEKRINAIEAIIADLESKNDDGAPEDEVMEIAEEQGHNTEKIKHGIQKLKNQGAIYEPESGFYRTT